MSKLMDLLIMFHEIHRLKREGFSASWIGRHLVLDRRTVIKYLNMSEEKYLSYKSEGQPRRKRLAPYEDFIRDRLEDCPEASAAQVHDWLKEHYDELADVNEKTVFNFVLWVRNKHEIPKQFNHRDFGKVEEQPYGYQAQADFGEYNTITQEGTRKKVYFFAMVLSRSRQKYMVFRDSPFTTEAVIDAHEQCFAFYMGIPKQIVYDQDTLMLVSENHGDLLLTDAFRSYVNYRGFKQYFCRKSDPQSKGKVENVVKYIKYNFLRGRKYINLPVLNQQAEAWLTRTGNIKVHSVTRKIPREEWLIEMLHLSPLGGVYQTPDNKQWYTVRKDNTIAYKGNFYCLPRGTYQGEQTKVILQLMDDYLVFQDCNHNEIIRYKRVSGKGKHVGSNNLKRDYSLKIDTLVNKIAVDFPEKDVVRDYLEKIRKSNPRYIRDQLVLIEKQVEAFGIELMRKAIDFCLLHSIYKATDLEMVARKIQAETNNPDKELPSSFQVKSINKAAFTITPEKSNISDYKNLMN